MIYFYAVMRGFFILLFLVFSLNAQAKLHIDISRGNVKKVSLALATFSSSSIEGKEISEYIIKVIKTDLLSTDLFEIMHTKIKSNSSGGIGFLSLLNNTKASLVLTTHIQELPNKINTKFRLWDVYSHKQLIGKSLTLHGNNWRRIAHIIADVIYTRVTGDKGYFDTRIVYVDETGSNLRRRTRLAIMDQDGANIHYLTDGNNLVLTPRFSPESQRIVYMAYTGKKSARVYMLNIASHKEELLGNFKGITSAPRFSPDGKHVIMAVSLNGSTNIYVVNLLDHVQKLLTHTQGTINTSPSYSPDQKRIVFNSDRNGKKQLYVMNADGSNQHRITFGKGSYFTPVWSTRGDWIAFTKIYEHTFYIGVIRPNGKGERLLTDGYMVEGPTWSPNGRLILFTRQYKNSSSSKLYSVDFTGNNERIVYTTHNASGPTWSPLLPF